MYIEETKPEKANVVLTKTINYYDTFITSIVEYNDDPKIMFLDAIMQETHNYYEEDRESILEVLNENGWDTFQDGWDISLVLEYIEPFTEKQIDKDMFLTIKYPSI